jgi:hypothetical protein
MREKIVSLFRWTDISFPTVTALLSNSRHLYLKNRLSKKTLRSHYVNLSNDYTVYSPESVVFLISYYWTLNLNDRF